MPTYEYECRECGLRFERRQSMTEEPLAECPECRGQVHRLVSGGAGFILEGGGHSQVNRRADACSLEQNGKTCCGLDEHCGKPPCGDNE
ncbi:MAG: zinc ribbon domain-containing protein [Ignavibacteriales bacterium CG07_land_8_20_14_0_80_59_12]|nr:MAG: zinc ribbon domain-containing protein [Ignavibacteriales bacterium CG07_land_8_20_14_0_80_59_12]